MKYRKFICSIFIRSLIIGTFNSMVMLPHPGEALPGFALSKSVVLRDVPLVCGLVSLVSMNA